MNSDFFFYSHCQSVSLTKQGDSPASDGRCELYIKPTHTSTSAHDFFVLLKT